MSSYQPGIPTGLLNLDGDYQNIQNNFSQLNTTFSKNHLPITDGTVNNGAHTYVEMRNSATIPVSLKTLEGTIYTKLVSGSSQMFYTDDNSGDEYRLSATDTANFSTFGTNGNYVSAPPEAGRVGGWTFLPGGLILQYGSITINPNGSTRTISFPKAFTTQVYTIVLSFSRTTGSTTQFVRLEAFNPANLTNFTYFSSSNNNLYVTWTAIGI